MEISEENIRNIVLAKPVGGFLPFSGGDQDDAEQYGLKIVRKIESVPFFEVISEIDDYGSGYASYYDVFVTKKDKSAYEQREDCVAIDGITILISKLAPIAVFGFSSKTRSKTSRSSSLLDSGRVESLPPGDWSRELDEIRKLLNIYRVSILCREEVNKELWFNVEIPTVFDSGKVFDALFYWED